MRIIIAILIIWAIFNPKKIMGTVKEIQELPFWAKAILLTFISLIPLWIFSFVYLKPEYLDKQWYVIVCISLAISIGYYLLNLLNVWFQTIVFNEKNIDVFWIITYIQPVIELGIIMLIVYWFDFTFKTFIYITFGLNVWRCIFFLLPIALNIKVKL